MVHPCGCEALGGAEVVCFSYACTLQANGLPVSVFPKVREKDYGMPVFVFHFGKSFRVSVDNSSI
jgi:hypothetical protein